jgi:hypothetical protein
MALEMWKPDGLRYRKDNGIAMGPQVVVFRFIRVFRVFRGKTIFSAASLCVLCVSAVKKLNSVGGIK